MDLHALDPKALHRFSELHVTHDNGASAIDNRLSSILQYYLLWTSRKVITTERTVRQLTPFYRMDF